MQLQVTKTFDLYDNDIIEKYSSKTGWFEDKPVSRKVLYDMLMENLGFTREQSLVTMAALGLVGVNFTDEIIEIKEES